MSEGYFIIQITVKSGTGCKCANPQLTLTFTQDVTVIDGVPDWTHSSP